MSARLIALAALVTVPMIGSAVAGDRTDVFPPLYRAQAHETATIRPISELTTTPRLVPAAERSQATAHVAEPDTTGSLAR